MYGRRRYYSRRLARRRGRFEWLRDTFNNAAPSATLNTIDLMANYKTKLGVNVNLPEISIWRLRLKISITIGITGGHASSNDGVLCTVFVDGQDQTVLNQLTHSYDQRDMLYDFQYAYDTLKSADNNTTTTTVVLYKDYDIKTHRSLRSVDDTLFLQLAASGNATINDYSVSVVNLIKVGR